MFLNEDTKEFSASKEATLKRKSGDWPKRCEIRIREINPE